MISYNICLSLSGFLHVYDNLYVHPCCWKWHCFILFYGWVAFLCVCVHARACVCACVYVHAHACHIFFMHPSVDRCLGCIPSWLLWMVLQWTWGCVCRFGFCVSLDLCLGVGLLVHMAVLFSVFKWTSVLLSSVAIFVCIPTNSVRSNIYRL